MARSVRNPKIDTRTARSRLTERREPYWTIISTGCALGYRRGAKGGTWVGRFRDNENHQHYCPLGAADDARDPDGITVFSFAQAQERAREWFGRKAREQAGDLAPLNGPYTVADMIRRCREERIDACILQRAVSACHGGGNRNAAQQGANALGPPGRMRRHKKREQQNRYLFHGAIRAPIAAEPGKSRTGGNYRRDA